MTRVYCYNDDCVHCDSDTKVCCLGIISVEGAAYNGCNDYTCYFSTKEYSEEFYVLIGKRDEKKRYIPIGREKRYGKKLEYNGRTFYTQDKIRANDEFDVTDAKTGLLVGFAKIKGAWGKFVEESNKRPNIETFPVVERGADGKFHVVNGVVFA